MPKPLRRVIFTCGGTAGHINPAIALAQLMAERDPGTEFLFVGAERGLEKDLVPKAGYEFRTVHISSFHRSFKPRELRHNFISVYNLTRAPGEARRILREFRPDAVIGTGGYASYPIVKAAARAGIPTAVHESNAVPVRADFFAQTREEARKSLGLDDGRPLIVSFWGSLGAAGMNSQMAEFMALEAAKQPFHHIHGAGKQGCARMRAWLEEKGVDLEACPALQLREYIYDMAPVMRAADLVICRAGASTISELTALGVPALMVPSPYVTNNHQEKNARALEEAGGAVVLTEPACSGAALFQAACGILRDEIRRESMERAMSALGIRDAAERIYQTVLEIGNLYS